MEFLASATQNAGAALRLAGEDEQTFTSLLTAAGVATQKSGDEIARGLRTISQRLQQTKQAFSGLDITISDETGFQEIINAKELSNAAKALSEIGIEVIKIDNGVEKFATLSEVAMELSIALKEGRLSATELSKTVDALAGKNRSEIFLALINNMDIYSQTMLNFANASGSSFAEAQRSANSLEGRLNSLNNTWTALAAQLIPTEHVKSMVSFLDSILKVATALDAIPIKLALMTAGVLALGSAFKMIKGTAIQTFFLNMGTSLKEIPQVIAKVVTAIRLLATGQKALAATSLAAATAMSAFWGVATLGIALILPALISGFDKLYKSQDEIIESAQELRSAYNDATSAANSNYNSVAALESEFIKLSAGVNAQGENVRLTAEEYSRYQEITQQVADMFPALIRGYTDEGRAIVSLNDNLAALSEARKQQITDANNAIIAGADDILAEARMMLVDGIDKFWFWEEDTPGIQEQQQFIREMVDIINSGAKDAREQYLKLRASQNDVYSYIVEHAGLEMPSVFGSLEENVALMKEQEPLLMNYLQSLVSKTNDKTGGIRDLASALLQNADEDLMGKDNGLLQNILNSLDWGDLASKTQAQFRTFLQLSIITPLQDPSTRKEIQQLYADALEIDPNSLSADEVQTRITDISTRLAEIFNTDFDSVRENIAGMIMPITNYVAGVDSAVSATQRLSAALTELQKAETAIGGLTDLLEQFSEHGEVTASSLVDLSETFGELGGWEDFINVVSRSGVTMEEVQVAVNSLGAEYIDSIGILDNVTEENKQLIVTMLENIGVTNAAEVASARLTEAKLKELLTSENLADAIAGKLTPAMMAELRACGLSETAIIELARAYAQAQQAMLQVVETGVAQRLGLLQTELSGMTTMAEMYSALFSKTYQGYTNAELARHGGEVKAQYDADVAALKALVDANAELEKIRASLNATPSISVPYTPSSGGGSKEKAKTEEEILKEQAETALRELRHRYAMEKITTEQFISEMDAIWRKYYKDRDKLVQESYQLEEELFNLRREQQQVILGDRENELARLEQNQNTERERIMVYEDMLRNIRNLQIDYQNSGLSDNKGYLRDLENQYREYLNAVLQLYQELYEKEQTVRQNMISSLEADFEALEGAMKWGDAYSNIEEQINLYFDLMNAAQNEADRLRQMGYGEFSPEVFQQTQTIIDANRSIKELNDRFYSQMLSDYDRYIQGHNALNNWGVETEISVLKKKQDYIEYSYSSGLISFKRYTEDMLSVVENMYSALEAKQAAYVRGVQKVIDKEMELLNIEKERLENQQRDYQTAQSTVLKFIDDEIEKLRKANEEREKEIQHERDLEDLARMREQRTNRVFGEDVGFFYDFNRQEVRQKELDMLDKEREDALQKQIDLWLEYRKVWEEAIQSYQDNISKEITASILGADWEQQILNRRTDNISKFAKKYADISDQLREDVEGSIVDQINDLNDLADAWGDAISDITDDIDNYEGALDFIRDFEESNYDERLDMLRNFVDDSRDELDNLRREWEDLANIDFNNGYSGGGGRDDSGNNSGGSSQGAFKPGDKVSISGSGWNESYGVSIRYSGRGSVVGYDPGERFPYLILDEAGDYLRFAEEALTRRYKKGGIDYTGGPAWLDGTTTSPEFVFNSGQAEKIYELGYTADKIADRLTESSINVGRVFSAFQSQVGEFMSNFNFPSFTNPQEYRSNPFGGKTLEFSIGEVHLHEVQNAETFARSMRDLAPNILIQEFNR